MAIRWSMKAFAGNQVITAGRVQGAAGILVSTAVASSIQPQPGSDRNQVRGHLRTLHPPADRHLAVDGRRSFVGIVAFPLLPVAPLPQVDFPTIQVSAKVPGASPETMAATVASRSSGNSARSPASPR